MSSWLKIALPALAILGLIVTLFVVTQGKSIDVLNPAGVIADKERDLMITATLLSFIVIIPVFVLTFFIAWRYRASNAKARYQPEWDHSRLLEGIWWGVPCAIILVLAVLTWTSSHELDPFRPIESTKEPLTVQVIAMEWKWLFIYPEQGIATVNYVQFPKDRPVTFNITADAPMNSFWIPRLGGQIYAMAGMETKLHLRADQTGDFQGSSANLSGAGFSGMRFTARASTETEFDRWVEVVRQSSLIMDTAKYQELAKPSESVPPTYYAVITNGLYDTVMMKYMTPPKSSNHKDHATSIQPTKQASGHH